MFVKIHQINLSADIIQDKRLLYYIQRKYLYGLLSFYNRTHEKMLRYPKVIVGFPRVHSKFLKLLHLSNAAQKTPMPDVT